MRCTENLPDALAGALDPRHRINTKLASPSGPRNLGSEREPGNQVARNHSIGAYAGAPEHLEVDKPRDLLVNLKLLRSRATRACTPTPSARFASKLALGLRLAGLEQPFRQTIDDLLRPRVLFHPRASHKSYRREALMAVQMELTR